MNDLTQLAAMFQGKPCQRGIAYVRWVSEQQGRTVQEGIGHYVNIENSNGSLRLQDLRSVMVEVAAADVWRDAGATGGCAGFGEG